MPDTDSNVMPSMVVRQQRSGQQLAANSSTCPTPTPQPRHLGHSLQANKTRDLESPTCDSSSAMSSQPHPNHHHQQQQQVFDQDGLVLPKRVLHHPVSAAQPIIRDLNRELKFNQIRGKNVLDQKSELRKALEKLEESKRKKEVEQERLSRRTSLELRLEERAQRIAKDTTNTTTAPTGKSCPQPESAPTTGSSSRAATTCQQPMSSFSIRPLTR